MPSPVRKGLLATLSLFCAALAALLVWLIIHNVPQHLQLAMAHGQVHIFEDMRVQAVQGGPTEAADALQYVLHYYESGTKQEKGSPLDAMVELARHSAIREIIAHLRKTTGEDLGDASQPWIEKFAKQQSQPQP